ncbi:hypothetical protein HYX10_04740 [Candidatus Woesearchaeota archaeon]|nr:hypothetical protein [Candidatus Woesearchaeota archaeon]
MDDTLTLGGNIQISGFKDLEAAQMVVLKKVIGAYARKFGNKCKNMELLKLTMKKVHEQEHSEMYELHALVVDGGKKYSSEVTDRNLFFAVDSALKKVENEMGK